MPRRKKHVTELMKKNYAILINLIELKKRRDFTGSYIDKIKYDKAFTKAMFVFNYIVDIHSVRYKRYSNYYDIQQEGKIGLASAIQKFDPTRSKNFFKLANWYVKTRVKRSANKHSLINIPISSKERILINKLPDFVCLVDHRGTPIDEIEKANIINYIENAINGLDQFQKKVVCMYFGLDFGDVINKDTSMSVVSISRKLNISTIEVEKILNDALFLLRKGRKILE